MAVTETSKSIGVKVVLNNSTQEGKLKTVSVSLGSMSTETYDKEKAMNIVKALTPCLSKNVYEIDSTLVSTLEEDA